MGGLILGTFLALTPFALRNYWVAKEPAFLPCDGGIHFYIGNHKAAWGGYTPVPE